MVSYPKVLVCYLFKENILPLLLQYFCPLHRQETEGRQEAPRTQVRSEPYHYACRAERGLKADYITFTIQAKLVVIAADVDPIELVLWLPRLCKKSEVPYAFVKSKARLGQLVGQKTATAVALTDVRGEDKSQLELYQKNFRAVSAFFIYHFLLIRQKTLFICLRDTMIVFLKNKYLIKIFIQQYLDNAELGKKWGGGQVGLKSKHQIDLKQKAIEKETLKKANL
jgi:large subunit ribosomal protein L7Ae